MIPFSYIPPNKITTVQSMCIRSLLPFFLLVLLICGCSSTQKPEQSTSANTLSNSPAQTPTEYDEKGYSYWQIGDFPEAIKQWRKALQLYERDGNLQRQCELLGRISQAYIAVGQLESARITLETAQRLAMSINDIEQMASIHGQLGNLHTLLGNQELALQHLQKALQVAKAGADEQVKAQIYNHLGNYYYNAANFNEAAAAYRKNVEISREPLPLAIARINFAMVLMHKGSYQESWLSLDEAMVSLDMIKDCNDKIYAMLNVGLAYGKLGNMMPKHKERLSSLASDVFKKSARIAGDMHNYRAQSYALGYAGNLYEEDQDYPKALKLTRQATSIAQKTEAPEALYRWQWQTGRLFKTLGRTDEAIAAYRRSIYTLQSIRHEMDSCFGNSSSAFRDRAGTISFELVDLLLKRASVDIGEEQQAQLLMEARDLVELLRVYELRNYFNDDCLDAARSSSVSLDTLSQTAAIIYPIVLQDRTELLVSLPTGLKQYSLPIDNATLIKEVREMRRKLEKRTTWEFMEHAQKLYDALMRPVEADLVALKVDTLVFVPSGALRTIPLAALHDGKQFLNSRYATAVTPGLYLTDPHPVNRQNMQLIIAGLTKSTQDFPPLPYVMDELQAISSLYESTIMLDEDFVASEFKQALRREQFNVLHVASHGQFQNDVNKTFILSFDEKITMASLNEYIGFLQFRKEPLDLLTLSACETAAGDDLAALGLAGVAVKAGARSALATLWHINDAATSILIEEFYRQIQNPKISRAVALQQAQIKLGHDPRYEHPAYWSPFLLINNWL